MAQGNIVLLALYDLDSLAIRTLHAVLARAGFPVHSVFFKQLNPNNTMDPATEEEIASLMGLLRELKPVMVGLSVRSTYFQLAATLSTRIKLELKDCLVLWGGVHATIRPRQSLEFADAVCLGEGEETLIELARNLAEGRPIDTIQNLWIKKGSAIVEQPQRPLISDLDALPFPDYLNENKYLVEDGRIGPPPVPEARVSYWMMTSRGCPYNCTYCCNNVLRQIYKGQGSYVRRRSVESTIEELRQAKAQFPNLVFVNFEDDVFTFDRAWLRQFKDRYKEEIGLSFFCYCHPKATNEEMIGLLRETGAVSMTMGIQSGSERTRNEYFKRHDTNEEIVRAADTLSRNGVHCSYDLIMDNPLEDESDRQATLDLLLRLPRPFELHTHTLTHFPETDLTRLLLERGLIKPGDVEDIKQESYTRWTPTLDLARDRENMFWDNLYYLASKRSVPEGLIRWLSRRWLLRRCPKALTVLLRLTSDYVQTVRAGSRFDWVRVKVVRKLRQMRAKLARS